MTVEAALALCSLVLVLALALAGLAAVAAQLRCQDAAREAARLVARGETERARRVAASIAPEGARVDIQVSGDEVTVGVAGPGVGPLPGLVVSGRAVGVLEPGALLGAAGDPPAEGPTGEATAPPDRPDTGPVGTSNPVPAVPAVPPERPDPDPVDAPDPVSSAPTDPGGAP